MKKFVVFNDLHLGVQRANGTTPATALALRHALLADIATMMDAVVTDDIIFNGDVFDQFMIPLFDAVEFMRICRDWLTCRPMRHIHFGRGNHDISKDNSKLSVFDMVGQVMVAQFPNRFIVHDQPGIVADKIWIIPHLDNQELFNDALAAYSDGTVPSGSVVLLHANYDNHFAVEADHSLNVSIEQAQKFAARGVQLLFGHEHDERVIPEGYISGNQLPTSIHDVYSCTGKFYTELSLVDDAIVIAPKKLTDVCDIYRTVDWRDVDTLELSGLKFIKITGCATGEEAADVLAAATRLRARAAAVFVVGNGVQSQAQSDLESFIPSAEDIKSVNVLDFLLDNLTTDQAAAVKEVLADD